MPDHHDRVLKDLLSDRAFSVPYLQQYMPPGLVPLVAWQTVRLDSANVEHVRQQHKDNDKQKELSDLNFAFKFKDGRDGACFVHVELQTTDDATIVLRTRHYQTSYLLDFVKRNQGVKKLPLVVSIIYYMNKKPFSHSLDIHDYFQNVNLARKHAFSTEFVDLSRFDDKQLLQHGHIAGLEMIVKSIVERNVDGRLHVIGKQIKGYDGTTRQTLIRYLSHYSEMEKQTLSDRIINQEPELETDMRTVAQQWIDEGVTLGEQKGIEKGIAKVALNLLDEKADIALVAKATGLTESQLIALKSRYTIH